MIKELLDYIHWTVYVFNDMPFTKSAAYLAWVGVCWNAWAGIPTLDALITATLIAVGYLIWAGFALYFNKEV